jgi:hypothetical protein
MKSALLVLGYVEPSVLRAAMPVYKAAGFDIFLHVDAKADIARYREELGEIAGQCLFIEQRIHIFWGGYSMVEAELALVNAAMSKANYDRFTLVSDDSFPMMRGDALQAYFENDFDRVSIRKLEPNEQFMSRYTNYFYLDHPASALRGRPIEMSRIDEQFLYHMRKIEDLRKTGKKQIGVYYGSQWWSLSRGSMDIILNQMASDPHLMESFRYSAVPDELLFPTLIGNFIPHSNFRGSLMFVDWSKEPKPYVFKNYEEVKSIGSTHAFARKFTSNMPDGYNAILRSFE